MQKKIFKIFFIFSFLTTLLFIATICISLFFYRVNLEKNSLHNYMQIIIGQLQKYGENDLDNISKSFTNLRIMLIDKDGKVLFNNKPNEQSTDNYLSRPEIQEAFNLGCASSSRYSTTLNRSTVYYACSFDKRILRISITYESIFGEYSHLSEAITVFVIFLIFLSYSLSKYIANNITFPLNNINLSDHRRLISPYKELSPFIDKINTQNTLIKNQIDDLSKRNHEINAIIKGMSEGLVLLDKNLNILYINKSAQNFFNIQKEDSENIKQINFDPKITEALVRNKNKREYIELQQQGRIYNICVSNLNMPGNNQDTVHTLTILDITERAQLEAQRQEFTANVSHELKTPLQSIIGYCDLIENNLIESSRAPEFINKIHKQASTLVSLIEDILFLGRLDEKVITESENIIINNVCSEIFDILSSKAKASEISLILKSNTSIQIKAPYIYIYQLIFNLVDNAIKYNVKGGKVIISLASNNKSILIKVKDTGIGIDKEHHNRLFERFYRVDKSHSRLTGGTGLGLSIVKRIVIALNGKIKMKSIVNKGSIFEIKLPCD